MSSWTLRAQRLPALRLDLRAVTPTALATFTVAEAERIRVGYGNALVALGEFFAVTARGDSDVPTLFFEADLSRCDRVGWQMDGGRIVVEGGVGDYVGAAMSGGELIVEGNAGALAACEMAGGSLTIAGNVGDFGASTLPGSMDGMRGGTLVVKGGVGARFGDRMRRGTAVIFGDAGDFVASRMVAGTIALGGHVGAHAAYGMRRGSVVFAGAAPDLPATFVPSIADVPVFWQLLARDLARHGGVFAELPGRQTQRYLGDIASHGQGELIVAT
jgi:formylmethanofuran dehydrogenase subunit C